MPKTRSFIWILLALIITGALCIFLWIQPEEDEDVSDDTELQTLFDQNDPNTITALSFVCGENSALSFIRTQDGWQAEGRSNIPIAQSALQSLLDSLEYMLAIRLINEDCTDPGEYGLDNPQCTVTLSTENATKKYLFGSYNEHYAGYYCLIEGEDIVYMVEEAFVELFDLTMEDLLGSDNLPDLGNLQAVDWQTPDGTSITALPDGENAELASLLSTLELGKWIDYGSERYDTFGLSAPTVATLTLWDGATLTLSFGAGETDEYVYLRIGDSEMIYLATCNDIALLSQYVRNSVQPT